MARVHQAREALGQQLRELRTQAQFTGTALAELLDWPQSKVSKIETGRQTPSEDDIRAWAAAAGRADAVADLLARLRTLETMYVEWRRELRHGARAKQAAVAQREAATSRFRAFEATVIPGLLQTPDYAWHILARVLRRHDAPDDVADGVRARMERQGILYRADKRFHFLIGEAALRYRRAPAEAMAAQMDRLIGLSTMKTVRVGIVPFDVLLPDAPMHGFWILDEEMVIVETLGAELMLKQPQEVELYSQVFERLAAVALYGSDARRILTSVLAGLNPDG